MNDNLRLFMYTFEEYLKFSNNRKIHDLTDNYNNEDYISINTRLIILRKYGKKNEPVCIETVIKESIEQFPILKERLNELLLSYQEIENQKFEYRLSNGETIDLYTTIEDVMYGYYLHADFNRINRLRIQNEKIRFVAVRKYVEELESILFQLYELLKDNVTDYSNNPTEEIADIVYFGDDDTKDKNITSPYWQNLSGSDISFDDFIKMMEQESKEDKMILSLATMFLEELKKEPICIENLEQLIFPSTRKDWGDFSIVKKAYNEIPNAGISSKVRYNARHDMAYVRIMPNVEQSFKIEAPHLISNVYEICFYKENEDMGWKVFSFGGHLNDVFINDNKENTN